MIENKCFTSDWIARWATDIGCRNPVMLEKAIMALQFLGYLAEAGLPFQFKGGTSLLLRLNPLRRLSIDVDIVTQATPEEMAQTLNDVGNQTPFVAYRHDEKRDRELPPKKHYRIMYPSSVEQKQDHILLDVLYDPHMALGCDRVRITVPFVETRRTVSVNVPTINYLLGDKLTAFAPTTIGILYNPNRKTDIVKQLFDVGALFDAATDLEDVATAYDYMHRKQIGYRQKTFTLTDTLNDTIEAAFAYSQCGLRGGENSDNARMLQDGVKSLQNHLLGHPFAQTEARIAAAKAACLAVWLQRRPPDESFEKIRFDLETASETLREKRILAPWAPLDRLKGGNPEAFHYWYHAQRILRAGAE